MEVRLRPISSFSDLQQLVVQQRKGKMQKTKKYRIAWWSMMCVSLAFMVCCGIGVISAMSEYTEADEEIKELRQIVQQVDQDLINRTGNAETGTIKKSAGEQTGSGIKNTTREQTERGINAAEKEMDPPPHTIKGAQKSPAEVLMKKLKENMEQQKERKITLPAPLFINGLIERVFTELVELTGWAERNAALFETLHGINGDICGWITIDGTPIDYPVLRGETNDDYNRTSYNGSYSVGGSIFMDVGNAEDFSDMHTILYGHNMANGTMFKGLYKYLDSSFRDQYPYVYIDLPDRRLVYEVFSAHGTVWWDALYDARYEAGEEHLALIEYLKESSDYPVAYEPKEDDHILTLSTCNGREGTIYRYIVHAVLVRVIR